MAQEDNMVQSRAVFSLPGRGTQVGSESNLCITPPLRALSPPAPVCPGGPETRGTQFPPDLRCPTWWAPVTCGCLNFISCHTGHSSSSPQPQVASDHLRDSEVQRSCPCGRCCSGAPMPGTRRWAPLWRQEAAVALQLSARGALAHVWE